MTTVERATAAAELKSTNNVLQAARKELESARDRENKLLATHKGQADALSGTRERNSVMGRYLILLAIGGLAAWQMYLTLQLKALLP